MLKYFLSHNLAHRAHAIVLIRHDHCIEGHEVGNWWQTSLTSGSAHRPVIYNVLKSSVLSAQHYYGIALTDIITDPPKWAALQTLVLVRLSLAHANIALIGCRLFEA